MNKDTSNHYVAVDWNSADLNKVNPLPPASYSQGPGTFSDTFFPPPLRPSNTGSLQPSIDSPAFFPFHYHTLAP